MHHYDLFQKKTFGLAITICIGLAVILSSCASSTSSNAQAGTVSITYWAGHASGALHKAVLAEVQQFNQAHPSIHVAFKPTGASKHGLAAFEAGQAPNVAMISGQVVSQLAKAHAILDLKSYLNGKNGLTSSQIQSLYYPVVWQDMQSSNGKQYLMPLEKKSLLVIYYNKQLFQKAGITSAPQTWTEVSNDARKITALGSSYHGIAWTPAIRQFFDMTIANGGQVYQTQTRRQAFALNNAGAVQSLTMLRSWVASGSMILTSGYQYQQDFGTGNVGMLIDASAGYTYNKGSVGGKFTMGGVTDPIGSSGHSSQEINGASLALFNTGTQQQKDAAWTFMKWLSSPNTNTYWDEHTNYLPLGAQEESQIKGYYQQHPAQAATFSNPAQWWYKPRSANYVAARNAMQSVFDKVLRGQISVSQALQEMNSVGTSYLSGKLRA